MKVAWIPLGNVAIMAIVTALREWFRKSELSADRAGLLVGQDLQASMRGLMKLAGGNHLHEMNVDAFLKQAEEYESGGDLRDSVLKILNVLPRSHPFTTVRAAELKKWAESRDYQRIMDGHYPRRDEDKDTSVSDSFRDSATHYADSVRNSKDPLMGLVRDIAGGAGDLGGKLRDTVFRRRTPRGFGRRRRRSPADAAAEPDRMAAGSAGKSRQLTAERGAGPALCVGVGAGRAVVAGACCPASSGRSVSAGFEEQASGPAWRLLCSTSRRWALRSSRSRRKCSSRRTVNSEAAPGVALPTSWPAVSPRCPPAGGRTA